MLGLPEITTLTSEVVLSLYPILIKVVDTTLPTQILARLFTFTVLSAAFLTSTSFRNFSLPVFLLLGLLNLIHIGSSYVAFHDLPVGPAMALFFTYPFLNILFGWMLLGIPIQFRALGWFIVAFCGSLLIIQDMKDIPEEGMTTEKQTETFNVFGLSASKTRGVAAALIAAATESLIYIATLHAGAPFTTLFQLYGGALLLFLGKLFVSGEIPEYVSPRNAAFLLGFNVFIGFISTALRFWSVPLLPISLFSILNFIGVAAAYFFGARFVGEIPSMSSLLGSGLIVGSITAIHQKIFL